MQEVFPSAMDTPLTRQYQPIALLMSPYQDRSQIQGLNPSRPGTGPYVDAYRTGQPPSQSYTSPQAGPVSGSMNLSSAPVPSLSMLRQKRKQYAGSSKMRQITTAANQNQRTS